MKIEENHDEMWQEQYQNYYNIIKQQETNDDKYR